MHNFLLRYYVAEAGLDPDRDIQIRVVPPPEMVANLRAGNIDGFLGPDRSTRCGVRGSGFHPPADQGAGGTVTLLRLRTSNRVHPEEPQHFHRAGCAPC